MAKTPKKAGRPSGYSEELASAICERIGSGESLASICAGDEMPHASTVYNWLADDRYGVFLDKYTRARERQGDHYFDECVKIADEAGLSSEAIQKARLQVDARKWAASKLKPKKYGDKLGLTDGDGGPLTVVVRKFGDGE